MDLTLSNKPSEFLDKISALIWVTHESFFHEYWKKLNVSIDKEYIQVLKELREVKEEEREFLTFYFGSFFGYDDVANGNIFCLATTFFRIHEIFDKSFSDTINGISNSKESDTRKKIAESLLHVKGHSDKTEADLYAEDEELFFSLLKELPITGESKWNLLEVMKQPRVHIQFFCDTLKKLDKQLDQALSPLEPQRTSWMNRLKAMGNDIPLHIIQTIKGKEYMQKSKVHIYPVLIPFTALISKKQNQIYMGLGNKADVFFASKGEDRNVRMLNLLKLMADQSKFKILTLLKDKKLYANEIAERLQLSNATISHHMRVMTAQGLVESTRIQNKTYYYLNKEAINEVLHELHEQLT